jgi:invasion protein IalB
LISSAGDEIGMPSMFGRLVTLVAVLTLDIGLANAQQKTLAIYGDWTVSCVMTTGPGPGRSCGLVQVQRVEKQADPISVINFGRYANDQPLKILIEIRADAWIPTGVKLVTGDKLTTIISTFKWCTPTRCAADTDLVDGVIKRLAAQNEPGQLVYKTALQADVSIPISFKGFGDALDAFQKQ